MISLREARRKIALMERYLKLRNRTVLLRGAAQKLLVPCKGGKVKRQEVYNALAEELGTVVSNAFVGECQAVLEEMGGVKGSAHGYLYYRHLSFRSSSGM